MYTLMKEDLHFMRELVTFDSTLLKRKGYTECN